MTQFYFHIGYPKTATTTLQVNLFPFHSQIDYLGKYIPSFKYRDERLLPLIESLVSSNELDWKGSKLLSSILTEYRLVSSKPAILISTESFLHVYTADIGAVAARLKSIVPDARIIITIRNQIELLKSFFWNHGAYGQYLYLHKELDGHIRLPLSMSEWLEYQFHFMTKNMNMLPTLLFDAAVSRYGELFGKENVCLLMQEELRDEPVHFGRTLAKFMAINPDEAIALTSGKRENARISDEEARVLKLKLRLGIKGAPNAAISTSLRLMAKISTMNHSDSTLIEEPWSTMLKSFFESSNRRLEELTGLPLRERGYP